MTEAEYLRAEARRCRDWARAAKGATEAGDLGELAAGYEAHADRVEARAFLPRSAPVRPPVQ